ncbi:MAG: serine/threonine-protein kinase [Acidimicrobiales bacterium]
MPGRIDTTPQGYSQGMGAEAPLASRLLSSRYRIGPLLGRGGMAEVYDGYDERLLRRVAVKVLRPDMAANPEVRGRFEVEARSAAGLSHPNVVAVFDTGEDDGTPFIVMERLPGETLADRMAAGPVDQVWLRRVAGDVLGALGAAHAGGIVHRDVKPGNILIGDNGCAKVADFGIAKSMEVASDVTGTGLLVGTPAYLAPERLAGLPATERSDLYSVGVLLYEALAGAKPFDGPTPVAVAHAILHAEPRPLPDLRPDVDPGFAAAVARAMDRDPAARPASARELQLELDGRPPVAPDPTVSLPLEGAGTDATLVGAPGLLRPPPTAADAGAGPARGRTGHAGDKVPHRMRLALVAAAAVAVVLLLLAVSAGGRAGSSGERTGLVADIHELAGRVKAGDGPQGPAAAERLDTVADHVAAGGGADEANALLADAARWAQEGRLSASATAAMATVLGRIDGVDPALATPTTAAAPTTAVPVTEPPAPVPSDEGNGRGRKRDKDDD